MKIDTLSVTLLSLHLSYHCCFLALKQKVQWSEYILCSVMHKNLEPKTNSTFLSKMSDF